MQRSEIERLLSEVEKRLEAEPRLIEIGSVERAVFVGDTHGDLEATNRVCEKYLDARTALVFLGDYVDRGPDSAENLHTLLRLKLERPENLFLLMGNHEGYAVMPFHPADFWQRLDHEMFDRYAKVLSKLPFAASTSNGIIALHGVLPDVEDLPFINGIEIGGEGWRQITWGDWVDGAGGYLGDGFPSGRPQFGRGWFEMLMSRFGKQVLIRSHQPDADPLLYGGRCLTIFTSLSYRSARSGRAVAIVDLSRPVRTAEDLVIEEV